MAKVKKVFVCTKCGTQGPKWMGRCNGCNEWNTIIEEIVDRRPNLRGVSQGEAMMEGVQPIVLTDIKAEALSRMITPNGELNRVLGGGVVPGSIVLIGGEPGIGKSTLMLQVALGMNAKVMYVSGEESAQQVKMRADRLGYIKSQCIILTEVNLAKILKHAYKVKPDMLVVDSIQTLVSPTIESTPGSVSQVRESAGELQRYAKESGVPVLVIGHINKEGSIAGPKLLEHIVDTVLLFEGDRNYAYRMLRTKKNRFGSTDELGIYEMRGSGLREVTNSSELLLSQTEEDMSGSTVCASIEGMRAMLIETQALVSGAVYGNPQRVPTGFDTRRLGMLLAVLEKKLGLPFGQNDVFLNMAGGIRVDDPAIDLSVVTALMSSLLDVSVIGKQCFAGEVGLSGEVRSVSRIELRIQEAKRLGFDRIFVSKNNLKGLDLGRIDIDVVGIAKVHDLYERLFEF